MHRTDSACVHELSTQFPGSQCKRRTPGVKDWRPLWILDKSRCISKGCRRRGDVWLELSRGLCPQHKDVVVYKWAHRPLRVCSISSGGTPCTDLYRRRARQGWGPFHKAPGRIILQTLGTRVHERCRCFAEVR